MARNASGTYSLPGAVNPVVTNTQITITWANTTLSDLASEMTNSLDRQGRGAMLAALKLVDGAVGAPGLSFSGESTSGLYRAGSNDLRMAIAGVYRQLWNTAGTQISGALVQANGDFSFTGAGTADSDACRVFSVGGTLFLQHGLGDLTVFRDQFGAQIATLTASGQLSVVNNTNPGVFVSREAGGQVFGGTNSLDADWYVSLTAQGAPQKYAFMGTSTNTEFHLATANVARWFLSTGGHYIPMLNNTYNLGDATLRPATVYGVAGNFSGNVGVTGTLTAGALSGPLSAGPIGSNVTIAAPGGIQVLSVGYRGIPQRGAIAGNYTAVFEDAGWHLYYTGAGGHTLTIPANGSVAYPVGTTLTFVNEGSGNVTIAITTDTLRMAGSGATGSRTLAANGRATALKVTATAWQISGVNLS